MKNRYIDVSQEAGKAFIQRNIQGSFTMLNLLRFASIADYKAARHLAPTASITGKKAYDLYIESALPILEEAGSSILFQGKGGSFTIGPTDEYWDLVLLVRHRSVSDFLAFAQNKAYLAIAGHRTAALEDSRLLAIESNHT